MFAWTVTVAEYCVVVKVIVTAVRLPRDVLNFVNVRRSESVPGGTGKVAGVVVTVPLSLLTRNMTSGVVRSNDCVCDVLSALAMGH